MFHSFLPHFIVSGIWKGSGNFPELPGYLFHIKQSLSWFKVDLEWHNGISYFLHFLVIREQCLHALQWPAYIHFPTQFQANGIFLSGVLPKVLREVLETFSWLPDTVQEAQFSTRGLGAEAMGFCPAPSFSMWCPGPQLLFTFSAFPKQEAVLTTLC